MRTASEIDAAKAVLTTTDLGAVVSEVRQFPPGYVTGGRLKLNTNLQIEVAPIAINIAGKDVRTADTVIIGNEHWVIDGVETPRVPGSWYYLYLSTAGQFAVSPNEPTYNNLYFAYYHPEISDLRATGKFYFGNDGTILYAQTSLESVSSQVIIAASTYTGENANYYCTAFDDQKFIIAASKYLNEKYGGGRISFTDGLISFENNSEYIPQGISLYGTGNTEFYSSSSAYFNILGEVPGITIENIRFNGNIGLWCLASGSAGRNIEAKILISKCKFTDDSYLDAFSYNTTIDKNIFETRYVALIITEHSYYNSITNNLFRNCCREVPSDTRWGAIHLGDTYNNLVTNNICVDCGNLIDRSTCEVSSTSPMMFGEAAPTASNATWGFTATGPYEGTGQYRFSKTVAAGTKAYLHLVDNVGAGDLHGFIPGTQYEWSGWFKCYSSASGGFQGPRFYQATTGGGASSATAVTIATASWQWVAVTATIYVNATTAYFGFWASASLGSTTYFDVDNVRLFPPGTTNVHNQNYYNGGTNTYDGL